MIYVNHKEGKSEGEEQATNAQRGIRGIGIVEEVGWAPGPVWMGAENFSCTGMRSSDRPGHSELLYQLRCPDPTHKSQSVLNVCVDLLRSLTFRHRASSILGQAFLYSPENAFYIFNQQIYFMI